MRTVGVTPPEFGIVLLIEAPPDLVDLLTATKIVNHEIRNRELSPLERAGVRFVVDELLGVALELVAGGDEETPPYSPVSVFDDLPY